MIRHRLTQRVSDERGFTLVELLVTVILIGILAAIVLALFLNQQSKAKDADAKSAVNNVARLVQACNASDETADDFRNCDTEADLGDQDFVFDPTAPDEASPCADTDPGPVADGAVRVAIAGKDCFVVVGSSKSGNKFWFVKHDDGSIKRGCIQLGVNGCPADGEWAG